MKSVKNETEIPEKEEISKSSQILEQKDKEMSEILEKTES